MSVWDIVAGVDPIDGTLGSLPHVTRTIIAQMISRSGEVPASARCGEYPIGQEEVEAVRALGYTISYNPDLAVKQIRVLMDYELVDAIRSLTESVLLSIPTGNLPVVANNSVGYKRVYRPCAGTLVKTKCFSWEEWVFCGGVVEVPDGHVAYAKPWGDGRVRVSIRELTNE